MMTYILSRLNEVSTWRGLLLILTAAGVHVNPDQSQAVITMGLSLTGLLGAFLPDSIFKKKQ